MNAHSAYQLVLLIAAAGVIGLSAAVVAGLYLFLTPKPRYRVIATTTVIAGPALFAACHLIVMEMVKYLP